MPVDNTNPDPRVSFIRNHPQVALLRKKQWEFVPQPPVTKVDGIFEGGGALGTAYIGALRALHDHRIWFARVAGNSAGAITAGLIAAGYSAPEIQWLSASYTPVGPRPASLPRSIQQPVNFTSFLDFPRTAQDFSPQARQKTLLWQALKGQVIDEVRKQALPLPTRATVVNNITAALTSLPFIGGFAAQAIREKVHPLLSFLPETQPRIGDLLPDSSALRTAIADAAWTAIVNQNPAYRLLINQLYEGGFCEGTAFLTTMEKLLGAKVHNDPARPVYFKDLPMELVVVAADTHACEMEIYSKVRSPNMPVAEAIRRSMSVPFVFQPRLESGTQHEIMDGGLCSNYPYWLFSPAGDKFVTALGNDHARPKLGFLLDEFTEAPVSSWQSAPPKFVRNGQAYTPGILAALAQNPGLELRDFNDATVIERSIRVLEAQDQKEQFLHDASAAALMGDRPYHQVKVPLKGYHWLDFSVNADEDVFRSMADRGWQATVRKLQSEGLIPAAAPVRSPYQP